MSVTVSHHHWPLLPTAPTSIMMHLPPASAPANIGSPQHLHPCPPQDRSRGSNHFDRFAFLNTCLRREERVIFTIRPKRCVCVCVEGCYILSIFKFCLKHYILLDKNPHMSWGLRLFNSLSAAWSKQPAPRLFGNNRLHSKGPDTSYPVYLSSGSRLYSLPFLASLCLLL